MSSTSYRVNVEVELDDRDASRITFHLAMDDGSMLDSQSILDAISDYLLMNGNMIPTPDLSKLDS